MSTAPTNDLVGEAMGLVFELTRMLRQRIMAHHDEEHCNMLQLHVLAMIQKHEGITMTEIAKFMKVASPSATSFVARLVKMGLLERATDPENRKLVRLRVTPAGQLLLREQMDSRRLAFRQMLELLPEPERKEFVRLLQKLLDSAKKTATL